MGRPWLINSRGLAQKVRNASVPDEHGIKDCCAVTRECPNCHHLIDNRDIYPEWPGFPVGVKFEPSDVEILEHLAAKCGEGSSEPHIFLDEFIPTLEYEEGICYTHPENLPGAKKDGSSIHFFYRTKKAYAIGKRKCRKITDKKSLMIEHVRWHKTGKTKAVMENGVQKGCKKVMVLYRSAKNRERPYKTNWVMHQYHLGTDLDEKEGGYVVCKIFYQQKQNDKNVDDTLLLPNAESDMWTAQDIPRTPMTAIPNPPHAGQTPSCDQSVALSPIEGVEVAKERQYTYPQDFQVQCEELAACLAADDNAIDGFLTSDEIACSYNFNNRPSNHGHSANLNNQIPEGDGKNSTSISDLLNLELDSPPEFSLQDLQFGSQDSLSSWLNQIFH
ncbi:unnamed protein product [Cuscuta epithymum]|uniref:NAC domain-containing protein n=2 Tax=Cuscuta epithymum TaxID=186058 RepID=A0AAV0CNX8_9ASTE|nr:unnamed protein product [Cuscuta epithymum]